MSNYACGRSLLMERTEALSAVAAETTVTIPTISSKYGNIRPMFLEICESTGDFLIRVNEGSTAGDQLTIVATDLSVVNRPLIAITPNTELKLQRSGADRTIDVRWLWGNQARDGSVGLTDYDSVMPELSDNLSVTDTAGNLTIPADAVELVVMQSSGGGATPGFSYGVGASGNPTQIISVPAGLVTFDRPYRIFVNDADVVRMVRLGDTNQTLKCKWRLAK